MFKADIEQACKEKGNFEFSYTRPSLDWYDDVKVSIAYNEYNSLELQLRYGHSWYIIGHKYDKKRDKWDKVDIGRIEDSDIPRFIKWTEFKNEQGRSMSILTNINALDGDLNLLDSLMKVIN